MIAVNWVYPALWAVTLAVIAVESTSGCSGIGWWTRWSPLVGAVESLYITPLDYPSLTCEAYTGYERLPSKFYLGPQICQLLPFIARDLVVDMVIHKFWLLFPALPPINCFVGIFLILLNN